jgi:hypothetical protein
VKTLASFKYMIFFIESETAEVTKLEDRIAFGFLAGNIRNV